MSEHRDPDPDAGREAGGDASQPAAPIRIGVNGAAGRMGATVCGAISVDPDLELVAAVDPSRIGSFIEGVTIAGEPRVFSEAACDVVVDFSTAEVSRTTVPWLAMHGIHAVVGTTGFSDQDLDEFRRAFGEGPPNCLIASNFAISAVLMMRFAEMAAPFFDTAEIIEYHHDSKADAPSGTAITTAQRMAAASDRWSADPTRHEVLAGARGAAGPEGIRIHAVRMRGMTAHQDVVMGTLGQTLTIRQDSYDRASFMPGVLMACKHIASTSGVTLGLDSLLGL